jgi:two-component system nitrate/nitrite response regulator NarL
VLVDDSEEFLTSAARLLESQGMEVVGCATSGAEALELTEALKPDVALVDIELGNEDGIVVTEEMIVRAPSTAVILISSYGRNDLGELLARSAASGFLSKDELGGDAIARLLVSEP